MLPENITGAPTAGCTLDRSASVACPQKLTPDVGISPTSVEQELDDAIQSLRTLSALAEDRGDIETAKELSRRMLAAIHSRSPEHIARLDQEDCRRLDELTFSGQWSESIGRTA